MHPSSREMGERPISKAELTGGTQQNSFQVSDVAVHLTVLWKKSSGTGNC